MRDVYLDYNGSAPIDPRVVEIMMAAIADGTGNASSTHRCGRRQAVAVDEAREHVAAIVGGRPGGVVFTSGATAANNLALQGIVDGAPADRPRIFDFRCRTRLRQADREVGRTSIGRLRILLDQLVQR